MENLLIYTHILAGITVLLLGMISFANRKGSKNHILIGRIYVGSMWWICLSGLSLIIIYRFSMFLLVISVMTFYASFSGLRILRRRKTGRAEWYDWVVAVVTGLFGLTLIGYGISRIFLDQNYVLALLSGIFGAFASISAMQDIKFFFQKTKAQNSWWIRQHIGAMGGSYIAAITAFGVQNVHKIPVDASISWLVWILPTIFLAPVLSLFKRRYT